MPSGDGDTALHICHILEIGANILQRKRRKFRALWRKCNDCADT
jgi:hypothetical protein